MIHWLALLGVAIPCFRMAWHLLRVWRDPQSIENGRWVKLGTGVLIMEFILAHSGIMLLAMIAESGLAGLCFGLLIYGAFAIAFSLVFKSWLLISDFVLITVGRIVSVTVFIDQGLDSLIIIRSLTSLGLWMTLTFATIFVPFWFPRLGMTDENIKDARFQKGSGASGLWVDSPHLAIAAGCVYFLLMGMMEVCVLGPIVAARHDLDVAKPTRYEAIATIQKIGGTVKQDGSPPEMAVDFSKTKVTDAQLVHLEWLPQLKKLNLRSTKVGDSGLVNLKGLTQLTELNLSSTQVSNDGLVHLIGLTRLTELKLNSTQVSGAGLANLRDCHQLATLELSGTKVSEVGLPHLEELVDLKVLDLSRTTIDDTGVQHLPGLTNLTDLRLNYTGVTDAGLENLTRHTKLERLDLVGTSVTGRGLQHLETLDDLRELNLFRTLVADAGLENLKDLTRLTKLSLNLCTGITDDGLVSLRGLSKLRYLDLGDTNISDAGLDHLAGLTDLRILTLARTRVTEEGADKLRSALPKCVIRTHY